jgi:hypothetical protein
MDSQGHLAATPNDTVVAGDARANENIALTATQTLFAREHNRIVGLLPSSLSDEDRFQIARRVVIAEIQYITHQEFLPATGVSLPHYRGYNPDRPPHAIGSICRPFIRVQWAGPADQILAGSSRADDLTYHDQVLVLDRYDAPCA